MQLAMEELDKLERKIHVTVPATEMSTLNNKKLADLARRVKIDGFRPGKIPVNIVRQRFGGDVWQEVVEETLKNTFISALQKYKFNIVGSAQFNPINIEIGQDFVYEAVFEIYPELPNVNIEDFNIKYLQAVISENDVSDSLQKFQMEYRTWEAVKRDSQLGDKLTISFEGKIDGSAFPGNQASEIEIELGKENFLPSFEHALIGMRAGETKSVHIHFPTDYHPDLADKTALFNIQVHKVEIGILPELDTPFIQQFGFETIDDLKQNIYQQLEQDAKKHAFQLFKEDFLKKLLDHYSVELPKLLVDQEKQYLQSQMQSENQVDISEEQLIEQAKKKVTIRLLVQQLAQQLQIIVDQKRVDAFLEYFIYSSPEPDKIRANYEQNENLRSFLEYFVLEDQVAEVVLEKAVIEKVELDLQVLLNTSINDGENT